MTEDIILIILTAYLCISPYFYAKAVRFGMKLVAKGEKTAEEPVFHVPVPKKKPKMTPEQDRTAQILRNIDNYSGDSAGQVKVEVKR